jgi:hypothetical protein
LFLLFNCPQIVLGLTIEPEDKGCRKAKTNYLRQRLGKMCGSGALFSRQPCPLISRLTAEFKKQ